MAVKEEFKFDVDDCHLAAEKIRSLHQSAGSTLTKRLLSEIELNPPNLESGLTKLNLGFGDFWIAEFSKFLKDKRFKPISEINHLIHSEELEA